MLCQLTRYLLCFVVVVAVAVAVTVAVAVAVIAVAVVAVAGVAVVIVETGIRSQQIKTLGTIDTSPFCFSNRIGLFFVCLLL